MIINLDLTPVEKEIMLIFHNQKNNKELIFLGATQLAKLYTRADVGPITRQRAHAILSKLMEKGILSKLERKGFTLTDHGKKVLKELEHRFKILETYCFDELKMDLKTAEKEAFNLLLYVSYNFVERLCDKMGKPVACPHNFEIPHHDYH